jgi:CheY-like chemotaxis protein
MSASVLDEERRACIAAGMDRHLAKPFRRAELGELLRETAETRGLVQAKQDADCCDATTLAQLVTDLGRDGVVALIDELIAAAPDDARALREAREAAASTRAAQTLAVNSRLLGAEALARDLLASDAAAHRDVLAGRYGHLIESLRAWRG